MILWLHKDIFCITISFFFFFFCMFQLNRLPSAICQQQDGITTQSFVELFQLAVSSKSENRKTMPQDALLQFFFLSMCNVLTSSHAKSLKTPPPWGPHAPNSLTLMLISTASAHYGLVNTSEGEERQSEAKRWGATLAWAARAHPGKFFTFVLTVTQGFTGEARYSAPLFNSASLPAWSPWK